MTVTVPQGFRAGAVAAGIAGAGGAAPDLALVVNDGPSAAAAGVFTSNRVQAAPVLWSRQVLVGGELTAVVLNSGGANSCTGPLGFQDTHRTAEHTARLLGCDAARVAVCSAGPVGVRLPIDVLLAGLERAQADLSGQGGQRAALALRTGPAPAMSAARHGDGFAVGGVAGGAGAAQPGLSTVLAVLTTDAALDATTLDLTLRQVVPQTFDRIDTAGATSTNDTVLLLASGASGVAPPPGHFQAVLEDVCADLARQLVAGADGGAAGVLIQVEHAANEADALEVGRALARGDLLGAAVPGDQQGWGRVLAAIGATSASFQPDRLSVAVNGVLVCHGGQVLASAVDPGAADSGAGGPRIVVDLRAGEASVSAWTNDLASAYVPKTLVGSA